MEFSILGPLVVRLDGTEIGLGGARRRALLLRLLVDAGRTVSAPRLVDDLWGDCATAATAQTLQSHVYHLRRLLSAGRIETDARGYRLNVGAGELDAHIFEGDLTAARTALAAADPRRAEEHAVRALAYWRGDALADVADAEWARPTAHRLEEQHYEAREALIDALLLSGETGRAIALAEECVTEAPLRERVWGVLIRALYRTGRQADALAAYQRVRAVLGDELGLEPSAELRELERSILDQTLGTRDGGPTRTRPALPSGVVTFLLTDIAASTRLWESSPRAMAEAIARHDEIIRWAVEQHAGVLVKARGEGDSTFSVFVRATDAAASALAAQDALRAEPWPDGCHIAVRMALHTGEALERDGDYYGHTVNRVARFRTLAEPDQVLVSRATADLVVDHLRGRGRLIELGTRVLRDLDRPETIYLLAGPAPEKQPVSAPRVEADTVEYEPELVAASWPLVGRHAEIDVALRAVSRSPGGAFVAGAAGVGKTRLVQEVVRMLRAQAVNCIECVASRSASGIPGAALAPLLSEVGAPTGNVAEVLAMTRARCATGALVVAIDDAHWLDDWSAALLANLARIPGVSVLVTARTGELAADAVDNLWKDELVTRVDLQPFSRADIRLFVENVLGGSVAERTVDAFVEASAGNALMVREILTDARAHGELVATNGVWRWSGRIRGNGRLGSLVAAHAARATPAERELVEIVALFEPLPLALAELLVSLETVDTAERAGLVKTGAAGIRLDHPLLRDGILSTVGRSSRLALARRISSAARTLPGLTSDERMRVAVLCVDNAQRCDASFLAAACRRALDLGDAPLAERLARAARHEDPDSFEAAYVLAGAIWAQSRTEEALAVTRSLVGHEPDDDAIAELAHGRLLELLFAPGHEADVAEDVLAAARERVRAPRAIAYLDASGAELAMNRRALPEAIDRAEAVLRSPDISDRTAALATHIASLSLTMSGRASAGVAIYEGLAPEITIRAGQRAPSWRITDSLLGRIYGGELERAVIDCETARRAGCDAAAGCMAEVLHYQGLAELHRGRPRSAARALEQAVAEMRDSDVSGFFAWSLALLAVANALIGDHAAADEFWTSSANNCAASSRRLFEADRRLAGAWVCALDGKVADAAAHLARVGRAAYDAGMIGFAVVSLHDALRLGAHEVAPMLLEAARPCEGERAAGAAAHAAAVLEPDPKSFAYASRLLEDAGMLLVAAETATAAASGYNEVGASDFAAISRQRVDALLALCEGARTPGLSGGT